MWGGGAYHVCTGACGVQKRVSDPLELELQAVVNHKTWVWDPNSRRTAGTLDQ